MPRFLVGRYRRWNTYPPPPTPGKWRELESRFRVRFPGTDFHCQSARFFLLALIIILTLYSHGCSRWTVPQVEHLHPPPNPPSLLDNTAGGTPARSLLSFPSTAAPTRPRNATSSSSKRRAASGPTARPWCCCTASLTPTPSPSTTHTRSRRCTPSPWRWSHGRGDSRWASAEPLVDMIIYMKYV